jgi:hypothetical protein
MKNPNFIGESHPMKSVRAKASLRACSSAWF